MAEGSKVGRLIKLAILGILLAGLGIGGYLGYQMWSAKKAQAKQAKQPEDGKPTDTHEEAGAGEEEEEEDAHGSGKGPAAPLPVLKELKIVNLEGQRKGAMLRCELAVLFRDEELAKAATGDKDTPEKFEIKALILEMLSGMTVDKAADPRTRETLSEELRDAMNEKFAPKPGKTEKKEKEKKRPKKPVKSVLVTDWAIQY